MAETTEHTTSTKTAVITGASSGIGRATALELAARGYNLVLAARRGKELAAVAKECRQADVSVLAVPTDVSDEVAVNQLAAQATEEFKVIDVWINGAGVLVYGKFLDIPTADFRQVLDTNVMGCVYGSKAALEIYRRQGYGTLINISSINAIAAVPYSSAYVASKAAVHSLTESIRMELETEGLAQTIRVCEVMPAATDTNLFQNAANYMQRSAQTVEPVYDPALVARRIAKLCQQPRRETIVGGAGLLMAAHKMLTPSSYERLLGRYINKNNFGEHVSGDTAGNLYTPIDANNGTRGGWSERRLTGKNVTVAATSVAVLLVGLAGAAATAGRRNTRKR